MSDVTREESEPKDPTRLCPDCRMPISILAVRCRFCGAEVGRPRKEQETFTVADLGGEQKSSYTISGNVTEALETFMLEERAQIEEKEREKAAAKRSLFGRARVAPGDTTLQNPVRSSPGLPDLDPVRRDLASIGMSSTQSTTIKSRQGGAPDTLLKAGAALAAVLVVLVLGYFAWPRISAMMNSSKEEDVFVYPNRAEEMLANDGNVVEALEEALTAARYNNTPENQQILEKVRLRVMEDISTRVFSAPFNLEKINKASSDITRAAQRDPDARILELMETANREVAFFKFILTRVNPEEGTAVFRLNNPFIVEREQTVSVGDLLQDRFVVHEISSRGVQLEDMHPKGGGRRLISRPMIPVAAD